MKTFALAVGLASLALTVTASPRTDEHEREHWHGRHDYNNEISTDDRNSHCVPETSPAFALEFFSLAGLWFASRAIARKRAERISR
ncbi:MAG TPA: hypothetical protein VKY92_05920 [Verrucomicrobiae bacterium]|nr:hypothetical protein [Verrucomicrobiae bacterium]